MTIGNPNQPFLRLLKAIDQYAGYNVGQKREEILIQSGNNPDFHPDHCQHIPFVSMEEFDQYMKKADLIICHGGCGSISHALRMGKVPIVVPRRKKYGEHINDHQMQLTQALANQGRVIPLYEIEALSRAISKARQQQTRPFSHQSPRILKLVSSAIEELVPRS